MNCNKVNCNKVNCNKVNCNINFYNCKCNKIEIYNMNIDKPNRYLTTGLVTKRMVSSNTERVSMDIVIDEITNDPMDIDTISYIEVPHHMDTPIIN